MFGVAFRASMILLIQQVVLPQDFFGLEKSVFQLEEVRDVDRDAFAGGDFFFAVFGGGVDADVEEVVTLKLLNSLTETRTSSNLFFGKLAIS